MDIKMPEFLTEKGAKIGKISVKVGDQVKAWAELMQIENSKGSEAVKTKKAGIVTAVLVKEGDEVLSGSVLATIALEGEVPVEEAKPVVEVKSAPVASSDIIEIKMPEFLGEKGAKIGKISAKVGDSLKAWAEIMQIENSKGSEAVKTKKAGTLMSINVKEGEDVLSGTVLATVALGGAPAPAKTEAVLAPTASAEMIEIKMPEFLGEKGAKIGKISAKVGDSLKAWAEIMQIENSKGSEAVKTKKAGTLMSINVKEGEDVLSGTVLATVALGGAPAAVATPTPIAVSAPREEQADILIIGGGTGGYMAAIMAAKHNRKVVLIEKEKLGGTCLNVGCIPTKTLIASSSTYQRVLKAADFGIEVNGDVTPNMANIIDRKDKVVSTLVNGVEYLMKKNQITVVRDTASFIDNAHVKAGEVTYTFNECIIATGSVTSMPPINGIDGANIMDSTKALANKELPKAVTIVGGGVIGMEFAFMYRNLGVEVTVVEFLDRLLAVLDTDLSEMIKKMAEEKGIRVELGAKVTGFADTIDGKTITTFEKDGKVSYAVSDKVLVAVGRKSNMEGLGLENTTIELNERGRGIKVDNHMKTSVDHIWAVGDINNRIQLAHAASEQGILAIENILGADKEFDVNLVPSVIFTDPEIATVGMNEDAAKKAGIAYKTGTFHYRANGKALTMGETEGFVRLLKDENDVIIGGSIIGADASALIAIITVAVTNRMKDADLDRTIFAHPTTAEVIHEASMDLSIGAFNE